VRVGHEFVHDDPQPRICSSSCGIAGSVEPPVQVTTHGPLPQVIVAPSHEFAPEQLTVQPPAPHFTFSAPQE
jgi:hypothetical protein